MKANLLNALPDYIIKLKMHLLIRSITTLFLLLIMQIAHAGPWEDFGSEFQSFLTKMDDMKGTVKKEFAVDQLSQLHKDLFALEKQLQYLVLMVENPGMIDNNLSSSRKALRKKADSVRTIIKRIGKKVPSLSKQTRKLQKLLYKSTYSKKIWPTKIRKADIPDYHLEHYLLTEGKSAFQITHNARKALEEFLKTH